MQFEAESNGVKYEISVHETRTHWKVSLRPENQDWKHYDISKEDYQYLDETISFIFNNSSYLIDVIGEDTKYTVYTRGTHRSVKIFNEENLLHESLKGKGGFAGGGSLTSGMPGKIVKVMVEAGQEVKENQPLLIMEAMKMENEIRAAQDATIDKVHIRDGDNVEAGANLITFVKA